MNKRQRGELEKLSQCERWMESSHWLVRSACARIRTIRHVEIRHPCCRSLRAHWIRQHPCDSRQPRNCGPNSGTTMRGMRYPLLPISPFNDCLAQEYQSDCATSTVNRFHDSIVIICRYTCELWTLHSTSHEADNGTITARAVVLDAMDPCWMIASPRMVRKRADP